jgi:hypothetical protein
MVLVRPGGLITLDNVLWSGAVIDPEDTSEDTDALRELNSWLHQRAPGRFDLSLVPIGDGLTILRKYYYPQGKLFANRLRSAFQIPADARTSASSIG